MLSDTHISKLKLDEDANGMFIGIGLGIFSPISGIKFVKYFKLTRFLFSLEMPSTAQEKLGSTIRIIKNSF